MTIKSDVNDLTNVNKVAKNANVLNMTNVEWYFTKEVGDKLTKYNITCNAICSGYFETELTAETLKTEMFQTCMKKLYQ